MSTLSILQEAVEQARGNPAAMQRAVLDALVAASDSGDDVVDPTNPFVFLLEASVANTNGFMNQAEALTRKQYPVLAQTQEDLYRHMADVDYLGRFGNPSRTAFTLLLGKEEVFTKAVSTGVGNIRKLVIPKHTEFVAAGVRFSMQYPIEIRIMGHGGLQVVYDAEQTSPLQTLETNLVDWTITEIDQLEFVMIQIPVQQFRISPNYGQLNLSTGFNESFTFQNQFYYARVYVEQVDGSWKEIKTTHTEQVYDPKTLTAVLKVLDNELNVRIPVVYFTQEMAQRNIRVDVYTTRGKLDMLLGEFDISEFGATWRDLDQAETSKYSAPLNGFSTLALFSDQPVRGGTNALTVEELRERVITNSAGTVNLPITSAQLQAAGGNLGYDVVKSVDNVTERIFKATRLLPPPSNGFSVSPATARISTIQRSMRQLTELEGVMDNGNRITLTPQLLYERKDGLTHPISNQRAVELENLSGEALVTHVRQQRYLYTPFYYVLDGNDNAFELRAYHLDKPSVVSKRFVRENDTAQLQVATGQYSIERVDGGYRLWLTTRSGDAFKEIDDAQITVQLAYTPVRENTRAYMTGTLYGTNDSDERVYRFDLTTDFDIDANDSLKLNSFKMFDTDPRITSSRLDQNFEIIYIVEGHSVEGLESSDIDEVYSRFLLDGGDYVGLTHEEINLRFGQALQGLWRRSRTVAGEINYLRHETDQPLFYEKTVYDRDEQTGHIKLSRDPDTGDVIYSVLHNAGDPVLDDEGNQKYRHREGDVVLDGEGLPVPVSDRELVRQFDIINIDGVLHFANDRNSVTYREELTRTIASWAVEDIGQLSERLLERTQLYYYPKITFGEIPVYVESGRETEINAEQSFTVRYYMSRERFERLELREPLTRIAIETIANALKNATVSLSDINARIKASAGDDVLSVETEGLAGDAEFTTVTVRDSDKACMLRKRLERLSDGSLVAEDDVTVEFIRHTL